MLHRYLRVEGRKAVIYCEGRLVCGQENVLLNEVTLTFMRAWKSLTVDLGGVRTVDAGGLGALATIARWAREERAEFVISHPTRWVHHLLHLVNLDIVIPIVLGTQGANSAEVDNEVGALATDGS
jgi:anti-anti-sigma regulatory factor